MDRTVSVRRVFSRPAAQRNAKEKSPVADPVPSGRQIMSDITEEEMSASDVVQV